MAGDNLKEINLEEGNPSLVISDLNKNEANRWLFDIKRTKN